MYSRVQLKIVSVFAEAPGRAFSKDLLLEKCKCHYRTLNEAIRMLQHESHKCIYVCSWIRNPTKLGRAYLRPVYAFGNRPDAPKPAPRSRQYYKTKQRLDKQAQQLYEGVSNAK